MLLASAAVSLVLAVSACAPAGLSRNSNDRFVRPGSPRTSPSGDFTASVQAGREEDGVDTWIVVIHDAARAEVFHDNYAYSTRFGVGVTWRSDRDQLWTLSSDVGTAYVESRGGAWSKTWITPETLHLIPDEIARLSDD